MKAAARWIALGALAAVAAGLHAQDAPARRANARISGVVLAADTGRPLDSAVVELIHDSPGRNTFLSATTRSDGVFSFEGLIRGTFILTAGAPRHSTATYRRSSAPDAPVRHTLEDGEQVAVRLLLPRLGSFSGRVSDRFGDPVPGIGVFALERKVVDGLPRLVRAGRAVPPTLTDDLGQFRLPAFPPGHYYIVAVSGALTASVRFEHPNETGGFMPTFYPGTTEATEAQPLALGPGQELGGLDITVVPAPMYRISGTVFDAAGRRSASAEIAILPASGAGPGSALGGRTQAGPDGTFMLSNIPPGAYVLQARSSGSSRAGEGEFGWSGISVAGADVDDLRLVTFPPATLEGRVRWEPVSELRLLIKPLQVEALAADWETQPVADAAERWTNQRVAGDGAFRIGGLWGRRLLRVRTAAGAVERILVDGRDVTDVPIEFNGRDVAGVEVVLTTRTGAVSGRAIARDGMPAPGSQILIFAGDRTRWTPHSRFVASASADSEGRYRISHLLPGNYLAAALPAGATALVDPLLLEMLRGISTPFAATEGDVRELELTVISDVAR